MTYMKHEKNLYSVLDEMTGKWQFQKEEWKPSKNDVEHSEEAVTTNKKQQQLIGE